MAKWITIDCSPVIKFKEIKNKYILKDASNIVWISDVNSFVHRAGGTVWSCPYCPSHWAPALPQGHHSLSTIDHHIVFSVKSTMSPEAIQEKQPWAVNSRTGTATCCLCSLLLGQTLTDPMSYSLAGKSNFSKISNLRKVKHALLCV